MNLHDLADISRINCLVDLHLHLDGSLDIEIIKKLAKIQGSEITEKNEDLLKKIQVDSECKNLNEFLKKFDFPLLFLQTKETIKEAVKLVLEKQAKEGLIYAEIRFAPQLHMKNGLTLEEVVESAIDGIKQSPIPSTLILCLMRGSDANLNKLTVDIAKKYLNCGVGGIDLAGAESLFPTDLYKDVFEYASSLNVPFTIHVGEADGYKSVETALSFGSKRIGHGIRSIESSSLLKELADRGVTLEICPTSNVLTRAIENIEKLPLVEFMEAGIKVCINQDDPAIEGTTLKKEFDLLIKSFNLTFLEVKGMLLNSVNASFAPLDLKIKLATQIKKEFDLVRD